MIRPEGFPKTLRVSAGYPFFFLVFPLPFLGSSFASSPSATSVSHPLPTGSRFKFSSSSRAKISSLLMSCGQP